MQTDVNLKFKDAETGQKQRVFHFLNKNPRDENQNEK